MAKISILNVSFTAITLEASPEYVIDKIHKLIKIRPIVPTKEYFDHCMIK